MSILLPDERQTAQDFECFEEAPHVVEDREVVWLSHYEISRRIQRKLLVSGSCGSIRILLTIQASGVDTFPSHEEMCKNSIKESLDFLGDLVQRENELSAR